MPAFFQTGEFYSLLTAVVWAFSVILFRKSGLTVPPVPLNLFKGTVALALLVPTLALTGGTFFPQSATLSDVVMLAVSGVLGIAIADSLFFACLNRLGAARTAVVDCLYSPFVVLCAVVGLGEPLTAVLLVALALMVTAVFLGAWEPSAKAPLERARLLKEQRLGVLYGVLSLILMAVGITMVKPALDRSELIWATTVRILGAVLFLGVQGLLPSHRAVTKRIFTPSREWRLLVPASVIGTYVAMVLWLAGMKYTHASISSVLNQMSTLFVPILGWLFLKERLNRRIVLAIFLGFCGAALLGLLPPNLHRSVRDGVEAAARVSKRLTGEPKLRNLQKGSP
ncbi:MAG: DMT family transporter [Polyangia bacterium]|jgi:drug/metabolite transporter (DMT)-like permease|nr:DMT family transporter [Polyangia bacterium]